MKILGTGLSGMVGSYVKEKLKGSFTFESLGPDIGVDITNAKVVTSFISQSSAPWILHFAAITDVDGAEIDRPLGVKGKTWQVNVEGTDALVVACKTYGKKLFYISTDFVFPGGDKLYTEEDRPSPIGWYAETKYEGEKRVQVLGSQAVIARLSYPYGKTLGPKKDFVGRIRDRFEQHLSIASPVDQLFIPTYFDDIAEGICLLIESQASGIYHLVGSEVVSAYKAAERIAATFGYDTSLLTKTTAAEFYKGRAPRAFQLKLSNAKIAKLGVKPVGFEAGLQKLKEALR